MSKSVLKLVDQIYPITKSTIEIYLEQVEIYKTSKSRDLIHLSVCLENRLDKIITYDREFKAFKKLKSLKPDDLQKQLN